MPSNSVFASSDPLIREYLATGLRAHSGRGLLANDFNSLGVTAELDGDNGVDVSEPGEGFAVRTNESNPSIAADVTSGEGRETGSDPAENSAGYVCASVRGVEIDRSADRMPSDPVVCCVDGNTAVLSACRETSFATASETPTNCSIPARSIPPPGFDADDAYCTETGVDVPSTPAAFKSASAGAGEPTANVTRLGLCDFALELADLCDDTDVLCASVANFMRF